MNEEVAKSSDMFENGYFWELYTDLERQFQSFLEYVPYTEENEKTYSFKLYNLILAIGGNVDSALKEMARYPRFSNNGKCKEILKKMEESKKSVEEGSSPSYPGIKLCLEAFEEEYKLSSRKVVFKRLDKRETLTPFKQFNPRTNAPVWWDIYNGLKHNLGVNLKDANLKNTLNALAGAFLLNVIHEPSILRLFKYEVLRIEHEVDRGEPPTYFLFNRALSSNERSHKSS